MSNLRIAISSKDDFGSISAEGDKDIFLNAFFESANYDNAKDTKKLKFLILGRTGTGKTSILLKIQNDSEKSVFIDPAKLSMHYLANDDIIKKLVDLNLHMDLFFKYLWKHVIIIELIKLKYPANEKDERGLFDRIIDIFNKSNKKISQNAKDYLNKYSGTFWETVDKNIEKITETVKNELSKDREFKLNFDKVSSEFNKKQIDSLSTEIITDVKNRTQDIINRIQLKELDEIFDSLKDIFKNNLRPYYLCIDDLDTNWMPHNKLYTDLVKSLVETVYKLNTELDNVKILIAMRNDIYFRVYERIDQHEMQREKLRDCVIELHWQPKDLLELLHCRIKKILGERLADLEPNDLLPKNTAKRRNKDALSIMIDNSFKRPRDIIVFYNYWIQASRKIPPSWSDLNKVIQQYSKDRFSDVNQEWKKNYASISVISGFLNEFNDLTFKWDNISFDSIEKLLIATENYGDFSEFLDDYLVDKLNVDILKCKILNILYNIGLIGFMKNNTDMGTSDVIFSYDYNINIIDIPINEIKNYIYVIHDIVLNSLGKKSKYDN